MPEPERMLELEQGELEHKVLGQKPGERHEEVRQRGQPRPRRKLLIPKQKDRKKFNIKNV